MKDIKVFDDIISFEKQEEIKNLLYGDSFPWYFIKDVSNIRNKHQQRPAVTHLYVNEKQVNSDFYREIKVISDMVCEKLKIEVEPIKVRSFMQFPLNKNFIGKQSLDTPHLDLPEKHIVFLYYVNDCDGETVIYDYKSKNAFELPYFEDVKIVKKIKPKQGRVVVFDGTTWHSSTQPTKGMRTIINFDVCTI